MFPPADRPIRLTLRGLSSMRFLLAVLGALAGLALAGMPSDAQAQGAGVKRVALVIGNAAYKEQPLKNPVNDAKAMAAKLRQIGFQVIERTNATKSQMEKAVADFGEALNAGAVGLFYYAGHGLQVGGRNFLVPVDATITSEQRVRLETLDVDVVLDQMEAAKSGVNLLILDACRNNPFERRFRATGGGLAQINAPQGTLIAYATAPGKVAADGDGANGLYTAKLLQHIATPGLPVEEVFKRVRIDVSRETNADQTPWESSSLTGSFTFVEQQLAAAPAAQATAPAVDKEAMVWQSVKDSDDPAILSAYLAQFPDGTFAPLAKARIAALEQQRQARAPQPPVQQAAAPAAAMRAAPPAGSGNRAFDGLWRGSQKCAATMRSPGYEDERVFVIEDGLIVLTEGEGALARDGGKASIYGVIDEQGQVALTGEGVRPGLGEFKLRMAGRFSGDSFKASGSAFAVGDPSRARTCTIEARLVQRDGKAAGAAPPPAAQASAPVAAATPRALTPGSSDGTWQGSYSCSASPSSGMPAFDNPGRVFQVRDGRLSGRFMPGGPGSGNGVEEYSGTIAPDGTVTITGTGSNPKGPRPYNINLRGTAIDGRFTATGKHGDRDCTLTYVKIR
jgi:uncharacterized caspase-like protein